jgi:Flp pilus assembly protein TadG
MSISSFIRRRFNPASFLRREGGSATIEVVLWVPFFVVTLMASGQLALVFFGQAMTLDAAQDATRAYAIGTLTSEAEVRSRIQSDLSAISSNVAVVSVLSGDLITTVVTVPASDFGGPLRFITQFSSLNVQVVAQQFAEI